MSYSRKSEARSIARGAVRIPGGLLPPLAAQALDLLVASKYAPSKATIISRAARETEARERKEIAQTHLRNIHRQISNILEETYHDR